MKNIFCIVGAGDNSGTKLVIPPNAFVIAADGGLNYLEEAKVKPDIIIGDFDSLGRVPEGEMVIRCNAEKDDTDTMISVREALSRGAKTILIYGGLGGRLDHSIANLQTLSYIANQGACGFLIGCGCVCTVIKNGSIDFGEEMSGLISVFCLGDRAEGIYIRGLKYELTNHTLSNSLPLGVSNEFMGRRSSVSVKDGLLLLVFSDGEFNPQKYTIS